MSEVFSDLKIEVIKIYREIDYYGQEMIQVCGKASFTNSGELYTAYFQYDIYNGGETRRMRILEAKNISWTNIRYLTDALSNLVDEFIEVNLNESQV